MLKALAAILTLGAVVAALTLDRLWHLPTRFDPRVPLAIDEPPNWLTRYKLLRLDDRPAECRAVLASAAIRFEPLPEREMAPGCVQRNAVRVQRTRWSVGAPFVLSCRAALSLALWERHVVLPQAQRWLGSTPQRLEHVGSYACRNVYGRASGRRSQHASADALDLTGFVMENGQRIDVATHWQGDGAQAQFLRAVRDGACRYFDAVLGPDYNREHADHLHLDRGPYRTCR